MPPCGGLLQNCRGSRHTALSKMWAGLMNLARWPAHNEQLISVADERRQQHYKRADVVVTLPSGQQVAGDVRSLGCHAPTAAMLQQAETKKLSEYFRSRENYQYSTEGQKLHENSAPVLVIISGNSLVFSRKIITSTGFYRYCAADASAPVVVINQSPIFGAEWR